MKLLSWSKDGGPKSNVTGLFIIEIKWLFSIVLLKFTHGTREAFHSHAFNCFSWVLKGHLREYFINVPCYCTHLPSLKPFITKKSTFHKVFSEGTSWVLSFRGPWQNTWKEWLSKEGKEITLTHGRRIVLTAVPGVPGLKVKYECSNI